jgi:hypothetical protein
MVGCVSVGVGMGPYPCSCDAGSWGRERPDEFGFEPQTLYRSGVSSTLVGSRSVLLGEREFTSKPSL